MKNLSITFRFKIHFQCDEPVQLKGCMTLIDLKKGLFSVKVQYDYQKIFINEFYQFNCFVNGYGSAIRILTKLTKVTTVYQWSMWQGSVVYVDDSQLQEDNLKQCL